MNWLKRIFGVDSDDPQKAAEQSSVLFVRSRYEFAFYKEGATGKILTAKEVFDQFGLEKIEEAFEYGSAIIYDSNEQYNPNK